MKTCWRVAVAVAVLMASVTFGGTTGWGQPAPPAPVPTIPLLTPKPDPGEVVHSWALAPSYNDPKQGGSRTNLSYEVPAGTNFGDQVTLFNLGNAELTFRIYSTDAYNTGDGLFELLRGDQKPTDIGSWVALPKDEITVPPGMQVTIPVTIRVPVTAAPGDHAGGILAASATQGSSPDGTTVTLDRRTGVRMYVRVAGPLAPKLTVEKLKTSYRRSLNPFSGKAEVTYRIENRGNVRTAGQQSVSVSGPFGLFTRHKASTEVPELLPGQATNVRVTFKGVAALGVDVGRVRLVPAPVGSAVLKSATWKSYVIALPFAIVAAVLVLGLLLRARRAYVRRQQEPAPAVLSQL